MKRLLYFSLQTTLALLWCWHIQAQSFEYNANCSQAYRSTINLKFDEARRLLQQENEQNPDNLLPLLLYNYIDALTAFISEQQSDLDIYDKNAEQRLKTIREKGNPQSPYYLYCQAEIEFQSTIARIKSEAYWEAFWQLKRSYNLYSDNIEKFPAFLLNYKSFGCMEALIGTLPDNYQWGLKIVGLSGSVKKGMQKMTDFLRYSKANGYPFYEEAQVVYAFFLIYVDKKPQEALRMVQHDIAHGNSPLIDGTCADIAYRVGKTDYAIQLIENTPKGKEYFPYFVNDYLLGSFKLYRNDNDASLPLLNFINGFKGKHYIKSACQYLAYHYWLQNKPEQAHTAYEWCKQKGALLLDADKKAQEEAESGKLPHRQLLAARLNFDGGYYKKSLDHINAIDLDKLSIFYERIEYFYRLARINHALGNQTEAQQLYEIVIQKDPHPTEYYTPKSCLYLGEMYEHNKNYEKARFYYRQVFNYDNYAYKNSLEQQAKAGLDRLK